VNEQIEKLIDEPLMLVTWAQRDTTGSLTPYLGTLEIWFKDAFGGLFVRKIFGNHDGLLLEVDLLWREEAWFVDETVTSTRLREIMNAL
jgi:hypothetical protein